jgi:T4-like virus Myoviridae tail sheath stabiliser
MTAPSNFFYSGQIRSFVSQFIRMVSGFYVEFGRDSSGNITYQRVPVIYGDQSRQAAQILRNNSENGLGTVPAMAVYIDALNYDQSRLQDPSLVQSMQIRQRTFDPVTGTYGTRQGQNYTVERVMPAPYKLGIKLDIWTSNTEQKLQLIEQLTQLFNPAMEIQSTDNYVDWGSLSYALLTDNAWTSRTVPAGAEEAIDVATMKFELPIWISTSAKVKRMGVIQTVLNNYSDLDSLGALGPQQLVTFGQYGVVLNTTNTGATLSLLRSSQVVEENDFLNIVNIPKNQWSWLLAAYGNFVSGSSEIRLMQPNGSEIVGTVAVNPTDPGVLIYSPYSATLPTNTLSPVNAIINPQSVNVGTFLTNPATGTRYLLTEEIGSYANPAGAVAWRGADGQDLVANAGDIVQYNGSHWAVVFASAASVDLQYVTNLTTGIQYKWYNSAWSKSYDGVYPAGEWSLAV